MKNPFFCLRKMWFHGKSFALSEKCFTFQPFSKKPKWLPAPVLFSEWEKFLKQFCQTKNTRKLLPSKAQIDQFLHSVEKFKIEILIYSQWFTAAAAKTTVNAVRKIWLPFLNSGCTAIGINCDSFLDEFILTQRSNISNFTCFFLNYLKIQIHSAQLAQKSKVLSAKFKSYPRTFLPFKLL